MRMAKTTRWQRNRNRFVQNQQKIINGIYKNEWHSTKNRFVFSLWAMKMQMGRKSCSENNDHWHSIRNKRLFFPVRHYYLCVVSQMRHQALNENFFSRRCLAVRFYDDSETFCIWINCVRTTTFCISWHYMRQYFRQNTIFCLFSYRQFIWQHTNQ